MTDSATGSVSHPQPFQHTFASPSQIASSTAPVFQTPQPPFQSGQTESSKHPILELSAGPTSTLSSQASGSDTTPKPAGDQGYVSPLIDLYPDWNSDQEALYHSTTDWELVFYDYFSMLLPAQKLTQPIRGQFAVKTRVIGRQFMQLDLT